MYLEELTEEIEDWLEKAEEEDLKLIGQVNPEFLEETIAVEILGYYGSVGTLIARELQKLSKQKIKLAGFFSSYFNEMIQLFSGEILLPITLLQSKIGFQNVIITTSSFAIPDVISYRLAEELYRFYRKNKVSKILLIDGVYNNKRRIDNQPQVHRISASEFQFKVQNKKSADFTLMGQIASSFLTYWSYNESIPVEIIVVDAFSDYDPISSLELMKVLAQEWAIEGNFKELEGKSQEFSQSRLQSHEESEIKSQESVSDPRYYI